MELDVNLENCYGIKQLNHTFNFSNHHTQLIYAPNGMMKSSFAQTLKGVSGQCKERAHDRLHSTLPANCTITLNGAAIIKEQVFVADAEDEDLDTSKTFSNFLADADLKSRYEQIYQQFNQYIARINAPLRDVSISANCLQELQDAFHAAPQDTLFSILENLAVEIRDNDWMNYGFRYNHVFDSKGNVKKFLQEHIADIQEYITNYHQLLEASSVFKSANGKIFGTHQATQLNKALQNGEFFGVSHRIVLQDGTKVISTEQLATIFEEEKRRIFNDDRLKKSFDRISKAFDGNEEVRFFKDVITVHPEIILELGDYEGFRKKVWKGYLADERVKPNLLSYYDFYQSQKETLNDIIRQAREQLPRWRSIIRLYNDRFHVPFKVEIENHEDIILQQSAAKLKFVYVDDQNNEIVTEKSKLINILSRGERRAFYILQLLFELESRKENGLNNFIVFDDIADSFDYQNKYAIIEYLHDLDTLNNMFMLVLTHNFDFYRTLASRMNLRSSSWMAVKKQDGTLTLKRGEYQRDLFSYFISNHTNDRIFISMIPFVRNLIEYTDGDNHPNFLKLTSCLHIKADTQTITDTDVINIIKGFSRGNNYERIPQNVLMYSLIMATANNIISDANLDEVKIENKIVLSIACRLKAEEYMKRQLLAVHLSEADLIVNSNQTAEWTKLFKTNCGDDANVSVIEEVNMMTPEFIHMNSFMYEPLIDLSIHHLVKLYRNCARL